MSEKRKYIWNEKEYLSEDELEQLITAVEAQPLMHPPIDFKNEILNTVQQKRKRRKEKQLLLYSLKVAAASAAALWILVSVPQTIYSREEAMQRSIEKQVRMEESTRKVNEYLETFNNRLNQFMKMEVMIDEKEEK